MDTTMEVIPEQTILQGMMHGAVPMDITPEYTVECTSPPCSSMYHVYTVHLVWFTLFARSRIVF